MLRSVSLVALFALLFLALPTAAQDQSGTAAQPTAYLNVRNGPGEDYERLTTLTPGVNIVLEARDARTAWALMHTADGALRGWVSTCCLSVDVGVNLTDLPVSGGEIGVDTRPAASGDSSGRPAGGTVYTTVNLRMRKAPGEEAETIMVLPAQTALVRLEDSPDGYWVRVQAGDATGWVSSCCLSETGGSTSDTISSAREAQLIAKISSVPVLSGVGWRARQIFASGQGNRPNVFSKVGDCLTETQAFLHGFGSGQYALSDENAHLQETIAFFLVSPREGLTDSFTASSLAVEDGFNAATVLDPLWADPALCQPGESPLLCEYRLSRPSVALIMLGTVDIQASYTPAQFRVNLSKVVQTTAAQGIIPVLTTFPSHPDFKWGQSLEFNAAIVDVARAQGIPLINLWLATRDLPNYGLSGDNWHPSFSGDYFIHLDGNAPARFGHALRNLLTLQMLDRLRREILAP